MFVTHHFSVDEVNNLISESFVRIFGNVVEHFPAAAIGILKCRPFEDINHIVQAIYDFLDCLKPHEKEKIFQLYPDLLECGVCNSPFIMEKEHQNGYGRIDLEEKRRVQELNVRYKDKFGFPFITTKTDMSNLYTEILSRVDNSKEEELQRAMREVKAMVYNRVHEIVH
ncbi:unnamed protein product [Phyllotreta striolata]|uniref:2-oxo-4-hydroxy-4-carboxy-5-ureidoimidazoline decarboxylase n=1 Tax=Phyllotreta striolata TaxID=444603 RepID=A0A9N9XLL1_PHYSR|nr:unnamed protein product [Phyllotreta striolata]